MTQILRSPQDFEISAHKNFEGKAAMVFDKFMEAKKFRSTYDQNWDKWYRYYSGDHWEGDRPKWRSLPVLNFIFSTIETILPIMTDGRPKINIVAAKPDAAPMADIIGAVADRIWTKNDMDLKLPMMVKNALKYGTGIAKIWWDNNIKPTGDVALSVVDPRHFFPSPGALTIQDAAYVIFAANVPIETVHRQFPGKKVTAGIWEEELTVNKDIVGQKDRGHSFTGAVPNTVGTDVTVFRGRSNPMGGFMDRDKLVTLVEMWHRNDAGEVQVTVVANGKVLKDEPSPFNHDKFPFVKIVDYPIPSNFWGMGEIQQLEKLQDSINQRRGQTHDILKITASPPFVADTTSGVNPKAMTNRPGSIIYKHPGSEVKWLNPPQLPSALFTLQQMDKQDFDAVSGVFDVTQGRRPVGVEAASAILGLQEAAQTRIRQKVRNMEASIRQMGEQLVALVQQFYTEERTIRIAGNGSQSEFVTVNQPGVTDQGQEVMINDVSIGEFDIEIGVGSTMPTDKGRLGQLMVNLFQLGVVDRRAVLENTGMNSDEIERIISRMEAAEQAQQEQAMQAMGPSGPELPSDLEVEEAIAEDSEEDVGL